MTLRYQVDSKLPEPVFIEVDQVVEIIPASEYAAMVPIADNCSLEPHSVMFTHPDYRPTEVSAFHPWFFNWNIPVRLDNGVVTTIYKPVDKDVQVGDYVRYNVGTDQMEVFDPATCPRKLTLVENIDAPATAG